MASDCSFGQFCSRKCAARGALGGRVHLVQAVKDFSPMRMKFSSGRSQHSKPVASRKQEEPMVSSLSLRKQEMQMVL